MTTVPPPRRPVVFRADRDTLVLLAAASGLTLALGYAVHNRPAPATAASPVAEEQVAVGGWAGDLAPPQPAAVPAPVPAEPMSTAAMTLPKAAMALPAAPAAPAAKPRSCDRNPCPASAKGPQAVAAATPAAAAARRSSVAPRPTRTASLADRLNPLNHLPDVVTRPFAAAGDTIVAWVKRF